MSKVKNVIKISEAKAAKETSQDRSVTISPPKFETAAITIEGVSPYVQHKFSAKARNTMIATQEAGSQSRKGKAREAKDFNAAYEGAMYRSKEGWYGIPASAFRNAMISACRIVGFKMTLAKLSLFTEADGFDAEDGTPLVRIIKGEPHIHLAPARNSNGSTDIRSRPMFDPGWKATVRVRWEASQFNATDVVNLLNRVGQQVGIGEGRADSRMSAGLGWGVFKIDVGD